MYIYIHAAIPLTEEYQDAAYYKVARPSVAAIYVATLSGGSNEIHAAEDHQWCDTGPWLQQA